MKTNRNNSKNNTNKPNQDIRNNALFTDMTVQEEVFVRGGQTMFPGIPERL
jgi:hypothetical protein